MTSLAKKEQTASQLWALAIAVITLAVSSVYWENGNVKLSLAVFPQFVVYAILGFYHAYNVWELENVIAEKAGGLLSLFSYFLVYTAWYNIVLLPESGIGYMEWLIVFVILTSNFITEVTGKKIANPFMGQRPLVLAYMGVALFLCKQALFYLFGDTVAPTFVDYASKSSRLFMGLFCICGIVLLLFQFTKHLSNQFPVEFADEKVTKLVNSLLAVIQAGVKTVCKLLGAVLSFPVIFILVSTVGLGVLIYGVIRAQAVKMLSEITNLMKPLLEKLTSTGKNTIVFSVPYALSQLLCMVLTLFYTVRLELNMKKKLYKTLERSIRAITDDMRSVDEGERKFEQARKLLVQDSFDEQLRINADKDLIAATVERC